MISTFLLKCPNSPSFFMPESVDIKRETKFSPETEMLYAFSSNKDAFKKFAIELSQHVMISIC